MYHLFNNAELMEVVRQSTQTFVIVRNSLCLDTVDENTEKFLKVISIYQSDKNNPHDAMNMYAKNAPTLLTKKTVLFNLPGEVYSVKLVRKFQMTVGIHFKIKQIRGA